MSNQEKLRQNASRMGRVTSWGDTSVTFKVQRGTLAAGGSYWAFVIDDNDPVRATQPIQL